MAASMNATHFDWIFVIFNKKCKLSSNSIFWVLHNGKEASRVRSRWKALNLVVVVSSPRWTPMLGFVAKG
jgi:hypothetical protein